MTKAPLKAKEQPSLSSFNWEDPFLLDDQLSDEERMLRDAASAYAQEKLAPRIIEAYREESFDPGIFAEMGEMGLLGVTVPEQYGGIGSSYTAYGLIAREIEKSRQRLSLHDVCAIVLGHVPDLRLRLRRTTYEIPAETCLW